ncbi:MAG: B12-binding domain-containing radical SAM protein, partial [Candidatus Beckwithbacteria bacterium]
STWNHYDMRQPIMKSPIPDKKLMALTRNIYTSCLTPKFIFKKLLSIRNLNDLKWFYNATLRVLAHLLDFS